ncbi:MAG: AMP-binding protein [Coriobacteriales bacterium]|jgi:acetyl-CoA synthetase|nr:AMP-binding protein [Coriobacteriales bacterium]
MRDIHQKYVTETYDENGILKDFSVRCPDDYNFAYNVVDDIAAAEPDRQAMIWVNPEGEEHIFTFGDMKYWSDKTANFLAQNGISYGDRVLVILRRHYQFWFVALALDKLGAIIVPATFMLKEHDLDYRINSAGVTALICTNVGEIAQVVDNALELCPTLTTRILVNGAGGGCTPAAEIAELKAQAPKTAVDHNRSGDAPATESAESSFDVYTAKGSVLSGAQGILATRVKREGWLDFNAGVRAASADFTPLATKAKDAMIMYFSSGTSGNPKMVLHDSLYSLGHLGTAKHWLNVKGDDGLHFTIADTGWGKAVWGKLYGQWLMETSVMTYDFDRFIGEEICEIIERYKVTSLCCPPTMYRLIMQGKVDDYDLSSLEYSCTAGEALNPDLFDSWRERTGLHLTEGFGQTETTVTVANLVGMAPKPGSMGRPVPLYVTKILDEDGNEAPSGQTGEICIAYDAQNPPPGIMLEYYRDPAKTAEAIYDGWYHTGDTAWRDEDGYFWYVGRNDDVIKSSGYRISPFEIESVLLLHPAVSECAVTGVPDPLRGKAVKATVVLASGFDGTGAAGEKLTKEIQTFMKKETAPYKYPRIIDYVSELPKTVNGKVRRAVIRSADEEKTTTAEADKRHAPEEFGG